MFASFEASSVALEHEQLYAKPTLLYLCNLGMQFAGQTALLLVAFSSLQPGWGAVSQSRTPVELTIRNFDSLTSDGIWFIDIYAPWCAHCKQLDPVWEKVAEHLHYEGVNVGKINAVEEVLLVRRFLVEAYPTLVLLKAGETYMLDKSARSLEELLEFALKGYKDTAPLPWYSSPNSSFGQAQGQLISLMISSADFYQQLLDRGIPAPAIIAAALVLPVVTCLLLLCVVDTYLTVSQKPHPPQRQQDRQEEQPQGAPPEQQQLNAAQEQHLHAD